MRAHEFIVENSDTITLWHGGKGLEHSHGEVTSSKKGRWQHGPGLYLTNSYNRAQEYAKGSRKVYRVTINRGTEISKVQLTYNDVLEFANQHIPSSKRKQFLMSIQENMERMGSDTVGANIFLNLIINWESVPSSKTNIVAQFLVNHGVDYAISSFGGFENEKIVVLFNRNKIVSVVPVVPKTISGSDFDIKPLDENIGKNKNKIYNILIDATGSGPFDGGCVVMAQAIQMKHGGDIVVLVGHAQHDTNEVAQHAAVKIGNVLVDYDGAFEPSEFVKRFERNELAHAGGHITGIRPIQDSDLPDAPRDAEAAEHIAALLK